MQTISEFIVEKFNTYFLIIYYNDILMETVELYILHINGWNFT